MLKILAGENSKDLLQLTPRTPSQQGGRERDLMKPSSTKFYMQTAALMQAELFFSPHDPIPDRICIENIFMVHLNRSSVRLSSVG